MQGWGSPVHKRTMGQSDRAIIDLPMGIIIAVVAVLDIHIYLQSREREFA